MRGATIVRSSPQQFSRHIASQMMCLVCVCKGICVSKKLLLEKEMHDV